MSSAAGGGGLPLPQPQRLPRAAASLPPAPPPQPPSLDLPYIRCAGTCGRMLPTFPPPRHARALRFCLPCRRQWLQRRVQMRVQRPIRNAVPPEVLRLHPLVPRVEEDPAMMPSHPSPPLPTLPNLFEYNPLDYDPFEESQPLQMDPVAHASSANASSSSEASSSIPYGVHPEVWRAMTPRTRTWLLQRPNAPLARDGYRPSSVASSIPVLPSASSVSASAFVVPEADPNPPKDLAEPLDPLCQICLTRPRNCIIDCMHYGMCTHCARQINKCPWCRQPILHRTRKVLLWVS
jgi:hypothetical protein